MTIPPPSLATRDYRDLMERLASRLTDVRFLNGFPEHVPVFLETVFQHSRWTVRIFAKGFEVLEDPRVQHELTQYIYRPGRSLKLLLQNPIGVPNHLTQLIPHVEVRQAVGTYAQDHAKLFMVMDDCGFRFEHEPDQVVANFNERKTCRQLIEAFDKAFEMGTVYALS